MENRVIIAIYIVATMIMIKKGKRLLTFVQTLGHLLRMRLGACRPSHPPLHVAAVSLAVLTVLNLDLDQLIQIPSVNWVLLFGTLYGVGIFPFSQSSLKYWLTFSTQATLNHMICVLKLILANSCLHLLVKLHLFNSVEAFIYLSLSISGMITLFLITSESRPTGILGIQFWLNSILIITGKNVEVIGSIATYLLISFQSLTWAIHMICSKVFYPGQVYIPRKQLNQQSPFIYKWLVYLQILAWNTIFIATAFYSPLGSKTAFFHLAICAYIFVSYLKVFELYSDSTSHAHYSSHLEDQRAT